MSDKGIREDFFKTVLSLGDLSECEAFFEDLCTVKELEAMSSRLMVARLLKEGRTFNEIEEISGASSATISRVNRCLMYGNGYKKIFEKE